MNVKQILNYALDHDYWELGPEGQWPDEDDQRKAAEDLVQQAQLVYAAGNRREGVVRLLEIAGEAGEETKGNDMAATNDVSGLEDGQIQQIEQTLINYPPSPKVSDSLEQVWAEMERRGLQTQRPAGAQPADDGPNLAELAVQVQGNTEPEESDAAERAALEDKLTFAKMRAHQIDPSQIDDIPLNLLRQIVEGDTPTQQPPTPDPTPEPQPELEAAEPPQPDEGAETWTSGNIVPSELVPDPAPEPEAESPSGVDDERDELEGAITGPMLKAYALGRKDVPELDNDALAFMIANPTGKVSPDAWKAVLEGETPSAGASDKSVADERRAEKASQEATERGEAGRVAVDHRGLGAKVPGGDDAFAPTPSQGDHTAEAPSSNSSSDGLSENNPADDHKKPQIAHNSASAEVPARPSFPSADEVVDREKLPIPADIDDPPVMPADMSKLSREELYSLHARFHAVEARINWIILQYEDEVDDIEKLIRGREVEVKNALPEKDGRTKITDAKREATVQADASVIALRDQLHEAKKPLRKLKVLQTNYRKDVERASRQMNRYESEWKGAR